MTSSDLPNIVCNADATSESTRLKVGASLIKNDAIISLGVNGNIAGWKSISDSDIRCLDLWMRIDSVIGLNCENF